MRTEKLSDYFTWVRAIWTTAKGKPLDFSDRHYLVPLYQDQHPDIVISKAAQMGISERAISECIWLADQLGRISLYTFPTQTHLHHFVQGRIDPVILGSDYLKSRLAEEDQFVQSRQLKKIGKGFIYLRGSQNESQIITIDADMVVLDERDRFDQENVPYIDKRTLASDLRWRREISTPTYPRMGISLSYELSDQREWMIKCDRCNEWQSVDFFKNVDQEKKICICIKCKRPIDRLKMGEWVARFPERDVHGYHISGILNPRRTIESLIMEADKAKSIPEIQQFYNQVLGLPYEAEGTNIPLEQLKECAIGPMMPVAADGCYAGADVGKEIHVVVSKVTSENHADYVWVGTVDDFEGPINSLEAILNQFSVKTLVIDAKPETRKVRELIAKYPGRIYAAYYPTKKFSVKEYFIWEEIKKEVYIDRTMSLDYLVSDYSQMRIKLPINISMVSDFFDQMNASKRVPEINGRTGEVEYKWIESGADHYFHAANYDRIARRKAMTNQPLLDFYKTVSEDPNTQSKLPEIPNNLTAIARWIRIKGQRMF